MAPSKRSSPASVNVAPTSWKKARIETPEDKTMVIVSALHDDKLPSDIPKNARSMLASAAKAALLSFADQRHESQHRVTEMIKEALTEIGQKIVSAEKEAQRKADDAESDLALKQALVERAKDNMEEAVKNKASQAEEVAKLTAAHTAAREALVKCEQAAQVHVKELNAHSKAKTKLEAIEGDFQALQKSGPEAAGSEKDAKKAWDRLKRYLSSIHADPALLESAPLVLLKKPEDRKTFDSMVIDCIQARLASELETLTTQIKAAEGKIEEATPDKAELAEARVKAHAEMTAAMEVLAAVSAEAEKKEEEQDNAAEEAQKAGALKQECADHASAISADVQQYEQVLSCIHFLSSYAPEPEATADAEEKAEDAEE